MRILGISAYYHDSAAALIEDGRIVAAAQEERFTRKRHDPDFPRSAILYCLEAGQCALTNLDFVVFYEKPFLKFERLVETYLRFAPKGFRSFAQAMPAWLGGKLFLRRQLSEQLTSIDARFDPARLLFTEHHISHAAGAFYPSPFEEALVVTIDGAGEWTTTSACIGRGSELRVLQEIAFPHSLGLLYSAFTYHAGFRVNSGEYKLMGLAPYGKPRYAQRILEHLIDLKEDGSFRLALKYFDFCTGLTMTNSRFDALFGAPPRKPDEPITELHQDMAASVQAVLEEAVLRLVRGLLGHTASRNLCLAGGVALNCVVNGKLLRSGLIEDLWVQPAAGDAGGALGAALAAYHQHAHAARVVAKPDAMQGSLLGPSFGNDEITSRLTRCGAVYDSCTESELIRRSVEALLAGKALGWFQGRMEYGPRALGSRSILADPRGEHTRAALNQKVKMREAFRPFAPAVTREAAGEWFHLDRDSPYMLVVANVAGKSRQTPIPAVTHADESARIQTVDADIHPLFHSLLRAFEQASGCPILVNTSFNVRGEPIVCTPEDAYACFLHSGLEALAIGNCFLRKEDQPLPPAGDRYFAPD